MIIRKKIMIAMFLAVVVTALLITIFSLSNLYDIKKNIINTLDREYSELYDYNIDSARKDNEEKLSHILVKLKDDFDYRISFVEANTSFIKNYLEQMYSENIKVEYNEFNQMPFVINEGISYYNVQDELIMLEGMHSILNNFKHENISGRIYYSTESGITIFGDYYDGYNTVENTIIMDRDWYKNAVEAQGVYWSEIYLDVITDKQTLTCSMPVYGKDGSVKGVIGIDIFADKLLEELIHNTEQIDEYIFMMKEDGTFLIGTDGKNVSKLLNEEQIKQVYDYINNNVGEVILIDDKYIISGLLADKSDLFVGAVVSMEQISEHAKNVGGYMLDTNKGIIDSINTKTNILFVAYAVIFVLSIFISLAISGHLTKMIISPLGTLSEGAKKIGAGNLYHKIKVDTNDELNDLADSFNDMTEKINKYIKELTAVMVDKEKLETELDVAKKIQTSMVPTKFPPFPEHKEFDIIASMYPARKVGGDFYDFFFIDEGHLAFDIADVSGKGVPAALFMGKAKTLIKDNLQATSDPAKALFNANNQLCEDNEEGMFVTAFAAILNVKTGELVYANAGHNPPLVYSKEDDQYKYIKLKSNFILAAINNIKFRNESMVLKKGERIFCYTDGVTESMDIHNSLYSEDRLLHTLNKEDVKSSSIQSILDYVKKDVDKFSDGVQQADDITMLSIEMK